MSWLLAAQVTEAYFSVWRLSTCTALTLFIFFWFRLALPTPVLNVEMTESFLSPLEEEGFCGSISDSEMENLSKQVVDIRGFVNQALVALQIQIS